MADVVVNSESKSHDELLKQGKRAYVLQDYNSAVAALGKVSEILVAEHGDDLHDSLADVYLYYGKSLLGLSREECEALGDAISKYKDDYDDDEEKTETEEGDEKDEDGEKNDEGDEKEEEDEKDGEGEAETNGKMETDEQDKGDSKAAEPGPSCSSSKNGTVSDAGEATDEKADNNEEPSDLQVAWEVLELAKKIFQRQGESAKKNLAETLVVLGEISLESENFQAAINDIKEGLDIQKQLFGKDSRTLAETYYKLGMAYSTNSQFDEAIQSFKDSLEYLQNRINNLKKVEKKEDEDVEYEIKEIQNLIPDIEEKITDMKSYKDEVCQCDIRTTIREFVSKPNFGKIDKSKINKLEAKRKPSLEAALENVSI